MPVKKDPDIKTNPWYYAFEVRGEDGKRKVIKKRGFPSRKEAELAESDARLAWNKGTYFEPTKESFGEYIQYWIDNKQNVSDQTRYNYRGYIKLHINPLIGHVPMAKINVFVIEKFISDLQQRNLADSTIKKIYNIINTALKTAEKRELIQRNPIQQLESAPRLTKKRMDYWNSEEVKKFLNGFEHRQKIVFKMAIFMGLRMGEILGLSIPDIDLKGKKIHIRQVLTFQAKLKSGTKTMSGNRSVTIPDALIDDIKNQIELMNNEIAENGESYNKAMLLVCTTKGKPLTKANLTSTWHYLLKKLNMRPIRFHDLRHTCASLLFSLNIHPKVVQELLGHSSIKITLDLYSHMMPNMQSDALSALNNLLTE